MPRPPKIPIMIARVAGAIAFLLLSLAVQAAQTLDFGSYNALIIGNNDYKQLTKLKMAQKDAVAVARLLRESYGFETELILNATRSDIINALASLRATLTENDNLLIYYAGHGLLDPDSEVGYWLPVNAEPDNLIRQLVLGRCARVNRRKQVRPPAAGHLYHLAPNVAPRR